MGSGGTGKQIYFNIVKLILGGEQNSLGTPSHVNNSRSARGYR